MKQNNISTRFFNFRLFVEGLKRLRVIGAVTATIALATAFLVPIINWINLSDPRYYNMAYEKAPAQTISDSVLSIPTGLMVLLAPFFFLTLFSFLRKRKESDFFHAIPYTRTCVYVSFVSAALAFIAAIQIACSVVGGLLWAACPYAICNIGSLVPYTLLSILAAAMISAFMMLALTVTGTAGTTMVLFVVFASLPRVICAIWLGMLEQISMVNVTGLWESSIASPLWYMPISVLYYVFYARGAVSSPLFSPACILYTLVVTLGLFALAGFLYCRRQSEMAGNPAPGKRTQALFRILFAAAPAACIVLGFSTRMDSTTFIILSVITLLCYFLYELCTTKRAKNLAKILPGLGILIGACVAFGLSFAIYRGILLRETVEADEIQSVSFETLNFTGDSYQNVISPNFEISDPEVLKIIAKSYGISQERELNGNYNPGNLTYRRLTMTIRMKDGRTLARRLSVEKETDLPLIYNRINSLDEFRRVHYAMPTWKEIQTIRQKLMIGDVNLNFSVSKTMQEALYDLFCTEFEALSDSQKNRVMGRIWQGNTLSDKEEAQDSMRPVLTITGYTSVNKPLGGPSSEFFHNTYVITEDLPKTYAFLLGLVGTSDESNYIGRLDAGTQLGGTVPILLGKLRDETSIQQEEWLPQGSYSVDIQLMNNQTGVYISLQSKLAHTKNSSELIPFYTFLHETCVPVNRPEEYELTRNFYTMRLIVYQEESVRQEMTILLRLTSRDIKTLSRLLDTFIEKFD